jgi:hypothetical protein
MLMCLSSLPDQDGPDIVDIGRRQGCDRRTADSVTSTNSPDPRQGNPQCRLLGNPLDFGAPVHADQPGSNGGQLRAPIEPGVATPRHTGLG